MNHANPDTIKNIHRAGLKEFLEKGFDKSSLRNIVKEAGVTTGAFYGYYKSKEDLYEFMAGEAATKLKEIFGRKIAYDAQGTPDDKLQAFKINEINRMAELTKYAYDNKDSLKLLVSSSIGTKYEDLFHELTEMYIVIIEEFMDALDTHPVSRDFEHILISGMIKSFCELIEHDVTRCEAGYAMKLLGDFYIAGWMKTLNQ